MSSIRGSNLSFICSLPPLGKPDPNEKYPGEKNEDTRNRVVQHGTKGECWYYVFNMLRERIGKHPDNQSLQLRKFEKIASKRQKEISKISATATDKSIRINELFFREINVDPSLYYKKACRLDPRIYLLYEEKEWEKLSSKEKLFLINTYARELSAERYGLQISSWRPSQSVDHLVAEMAAHGPLYVSGPFGRNYYTEAPYVMRDQINEREVYAWKAGAGKKTDYQLHHSVLLVAAKKREQDQHLVFFIDPNDDSDPHHPSSQKIYAMSYKRLIDNIMDLGGYSRKNTPTEVGFAYFGPRIRGKKAAIDNEERKKNS